MIQNKVIILKLGGSIITEKSSGLPRIKKNAVLRLAKELKIFLQHSPKTKIILLHGAGSFGHPLVYKHKLLSSPLTKSKILGFAEVVCSMRRMANLLADIFLAAKLPIFPIQASAILYEKNNKIALLEISHLKKILEVGFIPMLGGDMALTTGKQAAVVSADKLAVLLAEAFSVNKIIFASDVDGIFEKFPPLKNTKPIAFLSRENLKSLLKKMNRQKSNRDVTGQMAGKLETVLAISKKEVIIFNGQKLGNLTKALSGKTVGTRLVL